MIKTKEVCVVLAFCMVLRAVSTLAITSAYEPGSGPVYYLRTGCQAAVYILMVYLPIVHFKLTATSLAAIIGPRQGMVPVWLAVGWGLVLYLFTLGVNALEVWAYSQFDNEGAYLLWNFHETAYAPAPAFDVALAFILGLGFAAVAEEFLFRGLLLRALGTRRSFHGAALISTLIFMSIHYQNVYFVSTLIFSLSICYIYALTRSLVLCVLVHASFNFFALLDHNYVGFQLTRAISQLDSWAHWQPQLLMLLVSSTIIAWAAYTARKGLATASTPPMA